MSILLPSVLLIKEPGGRKISRVFRRNSASFEFYGFYRNKKLVQLEKSNNNCLQFSKQLIILKYKQLNIYILIDFNLGCVHRPTDRVVKCSH